MYSPFSLPSSTNVSSHQKIDMGLMHRSDRRSSLKTASYCAAVVLLYLVFSLSSHELRISNQATWPSSPLFQTTTTTPPIPASKVELGIPEKIWYKVGPRGMSADSQRWVESCLEQNPSYEFVFLTDVTGDIYVKEKFAYRPDIVETFLALSIPILKADILRYLLLYNEGGIYTDLDVSCNGIPIHDWIPEQYRKNASLVVGWEFDVGWGEDFLRQFATWTIMAKRGSLHLKTVVEDIMEVIQQQTREHNVTVSELTLDMVGDVVDFTGPRRMTRGILKNLKATLGDEFDEKSLTSLYGSKLVGDVLIMPGYSFALSSNTYQEEDTKGPALVTHHYAGSWKNEHGGEIADTMVV